jgi:hypothetical protein
MPDKTIGLIGETALRLMPGASDDLKGRFCQSGDLTPSLKRRDGVGVTVYHEARTLQLLRQAGRRFFVEASVVQSRGGQQDLGCGVGRRRRCPVRRKRSPDSEE